MTLPDQNAVAAYRRAFGRTGQTVTFRRVSGQAPNVQTFDATVTAIFRAYQPTTPVGQSAHQAAITEGLREFIVLESDLETARFPVPLRKNDKIIVESESFNITEVDPGKRVFAGAIEGKAVGV